MNEMDEIIDVVDSDDNIISQASRYEVHDKCLMHRSTHILVFNDSEKVFLQRRSMQKDESPGLWDTSSAGHVNSGENYLECANRELQEELGINALLDEVLRIPAQQKTFFEHVRVYKCVTIQKININLYEISEGCYWTVSEIYQSVISNPKTFTSTFHLIFNEYLKRLN